MGYPPVVVVESGGVPRTQVAEGASAPAFTVVESGARPITLADNAPPIALFNEDGTHYEAVTPVTILGASLLAWWTADRADLITLNSTAVTSWKDVVAGYDAVQGVSAARPTYSATSFNGAPGLTFDGVDDELSFASQPFPSGNAASNVYSVCQQDALAVDTGDRCLLTYGGTGGAIIRRAVRGVDAGANRAKALSGNGSSTLASVATVGDFSSRAYLQCFFPAGEVSAALNDGAASTPTAVTQNTGTAEVTIGATTFSTGFWNGKIRDVLITGPLTTEQRAALQAWALPRRML